ncbi:MAG: ATP-dependent DNA ligase, partial [Bryocella sp.]
DLAQLADSLAAEPSRLSKRAAIANAIRAVVGLAPVDGAVQVAVPNRTVHSVPAHALGDAGLFALYLSGQPFPEADPRKLNAGGALLSRAVKEASHATDAALTAAYRRHGDLGAAACELLAGVAPSKPTLMLDEVAATFDAIATARTTALRSAAVLEVLRRATAVEAKYLVKLMLGDMRIGVKQSLIEEAIAVAASSDDQAITPAAVRHAVMLEADLSRVVVLAFTGTLAEARMRLFHPLGFMLASPVESAEEAIERFTEKPKKPSRTTKKSERDVCVTGEEDNSESLSPSAEAFLEDKFDGMRAQLHCGDPAEPGRVALYSRSREDVTQSFPEIAEAFTGVTTPLILDGEILGWDVAANKALPFATLAQRIGRKKIDDDIRREIPVVFVAFDVLFERDTLLLDHPLHTRRVRLEGLHSRLCTATASPLAAPIPDAPQLSIFYSIAPPQEAVPRFHLSASSLVESAEAIDRAYADARARGNEGVMIKAVGSHYLPGRRGLAWVKLKRTLETLDVVITGAEYGHGRRAGLLSDYTFAVRDKDGELLNVGKAYSGVTDAEILELTEWLKTHTLEDQGHFRTVEPLRVLEVAFNNVMRSERHASGFALRFPRILRIRDDKPASEIDGLSRVEEIYHSQPDRPAET